MPLTVDDERFHKDTPRGPKIEKLDLSKPPGMPGGIPVMTIPHLEYPKIVYKHPKEPFRKVEHRNAMREVVDVEIVATEHLTKAVHDKAELEEALKSGWLLKPYVPQTPPDPTAYLYEEKRAKAEGKAEGKTA